MAHEEVIVFHAIETQHLYLVQELAGVRAVQNAFKGAENAIKKARKEADTPDLSNWLS